MSRVILNISDESKAKALIKILESMDFVEIQEKPISKSKKSSRTTFFDSAGIWKGRSLDLEELREKAWGHDSL